MPATVLFFFRLALAALSAWWLVWILLAFARRSISVGLFLVAAGAAWGYASWELSLRAGYPALATVIVPALLLPPMVRVINEYQKGVLFRFGRIHEVLGAGVNLILPLGIDSLRRIETRIVALEVPDQDVFTKDGVPTKVNAAVWYRVADPGLAVTKVADYAGSVSLLAQTTLRSVIGQFEVDDVVAKRSEIGLTLRALLDDACDEWGVKVSAFELKDVDLDAAVRRAMSLKAEAERERRARLVAAEGEREAAAILAEAARSVTESSGALQLRYLQTMTEIAKANTATVLLPLPLELLRMFDRGANEGKPR